MKSLKKEIIYPILFLLLSILFFYSNLTFSYLQMGDVILWDIKNIKDAILSGNLYFWNNAYFTIASSYTVPIHPKSLLMALLPTEIYPQVTIIFHITIMGYGLFLFLREKKLSIKAAIFGAVALMFSNAIITLILPAIVPQFLFFGYIHHHKCHVHLLVYEAIFYSCSVLSLHGHSDFYTIRPCYSISIMIV